MKQAVFAAAVSFICAETPIIPPAEAAGNVANLTLTIVVQPSLTITANPSSPTIACNTPAGTIVTALTAVGGNGNPVSYTISPTTDFGINGSNVVVAAGGIVTADCGKPNAVLITGTQP